MTWMRMSKKDKRFHNMVADTKVGDIIEYQITKQHEGSERPSVTSIPCEVVAVYPHWVMAVNRGQRYTITYGELIQAGYERQPVYRQLLIAERDGTVL